MAPGVGSQLGFQIAAATDPGLLRRSNQDFHVVLRGDGLPPACLAIVGVFDGLGGLAGGGEAASNAARHLGGVVRDTLLSRAYPNPRLLIAGVLAGLHRRLRADQRWAGSHETGTTATVAIILAGNPLIVAVGAVGDSLAFRARAGRLEQLVQEDMLLADLIRSKLAAPRNVQDHPLRNALTQALGWGAEVFPHVAARTARAGDRFLFCTDGVTSTLKRPAILAILEQTPAALASQRLVDAANAAGGHDNATAVVIQFGRPADA